MNMVKHNSKDRIVSSTILHGVAKTQLTTLIHQLHLPLDEDLETGHRSYQIFHGSSANLSYFGCYASVLGSGKTPHKPHAHPEEELLIVLDGCVDLIIAQNSEDKFPRVTRIPRGQFVYYPSYQHHTLCNPTIGPVCYLMFKWLSDEFHTYKGIDTGIFNFECFPMANSTGGFEKHVIFECVTKYLPKLHVHCSILQPGFSYAPHTDSYDVAILVLSGRVKTLDHEVSENGIVLYAAGKPHGMRNIGDGMAKYLVFEFHRHVCDRHSLSAKY